MKRLFKYLMLTLVAVLAVGVSSCKPKTKLGQGVTDTEIIIGNTATEAGATAWIGKPFNNGLRAYLEAVNLAGGVDGRTIRLINRDDGFDGSVGLANTEALVEDDKVFALVGHFGTPTINATLGYIKETGIPMVYAATGANNLYSANDPKSPIMPVQPIYRTEGELMVARLFAETAIFGTLNKVAVVHATSDDGISIKVGITSMAEELGVASKLQYFPVTSSADGSIQDYSSNVAQVATYAPDVVIIAANQLTFKTFYDGMHTANLNKAVYTSYVNAAAASVTPTSYNEARPVYANAWVDITSTSGAAALNDYIAVISASTTMSTEEKTDALLGLGSAYAIAGYIAAHVFVEGLKAVAAKEGNAKILNWKNFIDAMEGLDEIDIPMGSTVSFKNGSRIGIDSMSLLKYVPVGGEVTTATFEVVKETETIASVVARIPE